MKIKINRQKLVESIQKLQNIISSNPSLPILSNVLIETEENEIVLTATDLKTTMIINIPAKISEKGSITVSAKKFGEIVKNLSEDIEISTKKDIITLKSGKCNFKITGLSKDEFPQYVASDGESVILDQKLLKEMLDLTSFAISQNESRMALNGVLLKIKDKKMRIVATDGRRLTLIEKPIDTILNKEIIIPRKIVEELVNNLTEGNIKVTFTKDKIYFEFDNIILSSCLINEQFPNYEQVIPKNAKKGINLKRNNLIDTIKRASLLTTINSQSIKIDIVRDKLVFSKQLNSNEMTEELDTKHNLEPFTIGFNPDYLLDVLKRLTDETVNLELSGKENPAIIRKEDYICIVLPMQFE